ncbi:Peptidase A1 domain-containing protein [Psidium guajava]|nr:Peptidase A1 domain-containing protein [Psidium guajava]
MESDRSPRLKGVVIITLPPPDNPSLGKTITAFTLPDDSPTSLVQEPDRPLTHQPYLPVRLPPRNPELRFSLKRLFLGNPRALFGFLGVLLFAFLLFSSLYTRTVQELRDSSEDRERESFVFPLFPKFGAPFLSRDDVELKLGSFVGFDEERVMASIDGGVRKDQRMANVADSEDVAHSSAILPVRGNVYPAGLYFTYILVGTPPKRYYLDMDTGSDLSWIQCDAPCRSCGKGANALYKPKRGKIVLPKDSLCKEVQRSEGTEYCETCQQCDYEIEYADHSSSMGVLARDEFHLRTKNGSLAKENVAFGCAYDQQGQLLNTLAKTDGIFGLSRSRVSLPSQLASVGVINNVVGHCLSSDATGGGYMFLGDGFLPNGGMSWIPMMNHPSNNLYHTEILKVKYGSSSLNLGGQNSGLGRIVFDTGSSYTYFSKQAYSNLVDSLRSLASMGLIQDQSDDTLPICWRAEFPIRSVTDVKHFFKTLTLQFGSKWWILSTKFHIPPEGYLIVSNKGNVCLGILDGSRVFDGSTSILGDISLRGKLVVYDNVNQRIGWTQSDCVKPERYESRPFI